MIIEPHHIQRCCIGIKSVIQHTIDIYFIAHSAVNAVPAQQPIRHGDVHRIGQHRIVPLSGLCRTNRVVPIGSVNCYGHRVFTGAVNFHKIEGSFLDRSEQHAVNINIIFRCFFGRLNHDHASGTLQDRYLLQFCHRNALGKLRVINAGILADRLCPNGVFPCHVLIAELQRSHAVGKVFPLQSQHVSIDLHLELPHIFCTELGKYLAILHSEYRLLQIYGHDLHRCGCGFSLIGDRNIVLAQLGGIKAINGDLTEVDRFPAAYEEITFNRKAHGFFRIPVRNFHAAFRQDHPQLLHGINIDNRTGSRCQQKYDDHCNL